MLFLIEVEKFRENLAKDRSLWTHSWQEMDAILAADPGRKFEWKSRIRIDSVRNHMRYIHEHFIDEGSPMQICIPAGVLARTQRREEHLEAYGRDVYQEMSIDPMRTLERSILPQFVLSDLYHSLLERMAFITESPSGDSLVVEPPPEESNLNFGISFSASREFTLDEVLSCRALYEEFLSYLQQQINSENLLCKQMIVLFKQKMGRKDKAGASTLAWDIYRYFISKDAPYGVSLEFAQKNQLKTHLARPVVSMFDTLDRSVMATLQVNFENFRRTHAYRELGQKLQMALRRMQASGSKGCFGYK
jgi:hypothetical protein